MEPPIMTFGEALEKYMKSKKITIDRLRKSMNLKSSTSVTRILKDENSYKKVEEFYNNFITINPFHLVEYEKKQFMTALEVSRLGKEMYIANREMMYFVAKKPYPQPFICTQIYGLSQFSPHRIGDLFDTYKAFKSVRICMINCVYDDIIQSLIDCSRGHESIYIEQYIPNEENTVKDVHNFISILPILNNKNYNCYQAYFSHYNELEILNRFNNIIAVLKRLHTGEVSVDIISLKSDMEYTCVHNETSKALAVRLFQRHI